MKTSALIAVQLKSDGFSLHK